MVRMRLQLLKQDEVSRLEKELNAVDRCEKRELFLGSCRGDTNQDRLAVLTRLEKALAEYGKSHAPNKAYIKDAAANEAPTVRRRR